MQRRAVERRLAETDGFTAPSLALEQYPTPPDVAAHLVHVAAMRGDLGGLVVDLGAGTGRLALGAACHGPSRVVGVERDGDALRVARENERRLALPTEVSWVVGDATRPPLEREATSATVVANPPFGAQNSGADRGFLAAAAAVSDVSYTLHNGGSRSFVESFAGDNGGRVTDAFAVAVTLDRQFAHQTADQTTIDAEAFRIEWS